MISTDFAPNETWKDAMLSLELMAAPWQWKNPDADTLKKIENKLLDSLIKDTEEHKKYKIFFYLSGRAAIRNIIAALNLPSESQVIVQAFTCAAVPLPIIEAGGKPVYIDIEPQTYSMDTVDLQKKIRPDTKVIILQHTYGDTPAHRKEILKLAAEKNITVIEDLAHGWVKNNLDGLNSAILSFGRGKSLSSVFGGAIVTKDATLITAIENSTLPDYPTNYFIFRTLLYKPLTMLIKSTYDMGIGKLLHKILKSTDLLIPEITSQEKSGKFDELFSKKYPYALMRLLEIQLDRLPRSETMRRRAVEIYSHNETNAPLTRFPRQIPNRENTIKKMAKDNIFLGSWYNKPVGGVSFDLEKIYYIKGSCPVAEKISREIINLPTLISQQEAKKLIESI